MKSIHPSQKPNALRFVHSDPDRRALLQVFERARQVQDPDGLRVLIMLVSRRLACLYEMLVACGDIARFDSDRFEVVTDRVMDASQQDWSDRTTVLIDDVMNLGSALTDRYDDLVQLVGNPNLITVLVGLRDIGRSSPALVARLRIKPEADGGPAERNEAELKNLARELATCLYRANMPYFTDFPVFAPIEIAPGQLDALLATSRWMVTDVTAPIAGPGQQAFTFVPTGATENRIRSKSIAEAIELAELLKVRIYVTRQLDGDGWWMRIVPIGVPGPVMPQRLQATLETATEQLHAVGDSGLRWKDWKKPRAKHRLLQMYTSACLVAEFWNDLAAVGAGTERPESSLLETGHLSAYFGELHYKFVVRAFELAVTLYNKTGDEGVAAKEPLPLGTVSTLWGDVKVREHAHKLGELITSDATRGMPAGPARPNSGEIAVLPKLWVQRVLNVFGEIDLTLERPQVKRLKDLSYEDYKRYRTGEIVDDLGPRVLRQGLRLNELAGALGHNSTSPDEWERSLLSLAIDVGNDLGIAVPTTVDDGDDQPVFRQYRSGEGAFLADRSHDRLRDIRPAQVLDHLDALTRDALGLPLFEELSADDHQVAQTWAFDEAAHVRAVIPAERLVQKWVGPVVNVAEHTFTADVVTTLVGDDNELITFCTTDVLSDSDQDRLYEGALIEWLVYGQNDGGKNQSRTVRVTAATVHEK